MAVEAAVKTIRNYVGGKWVDPETSERIDITNPATGETLAQVPLSTKADVDRAVHAAREAFPGWRKTPPLERARACFELKYLLEERKDDLAQLVTQDGIECVEVATGIPSLMQGANLEDVSRGIDSDMIRQPIGVFAAITPFNFPFMVPMWFLPFAIACGNPVVLKPSEQDPLTMELTFELLDRVGLPPGVVNLVNGGKETVAALLEHPGINGVSFVGSTPVARYIYETAAKHGKRVQALGGAKNHMVVLPDADIEMAADAAVSAAYGSAGERCMAVSQVVAVGDAAEPLLAAITERIPRIKIGNGLEPDVEMGPLVTREHRDKVASYIEQAPKEGATVVVDGRETAPDNGGFFLGASLLDNVTPEMQCYRDEIFGPVLGITRVETYDEAVRLVNENPYGNGAAIFTRDGGVARRFQVEAQAGMIGINVPIPVPVAYYSFGGWKNSLFGGAHIYGPEGINFYTRGKVVTSRWPDPATSGVDLGFPQTR